MEEIIRKYFQAWINVDPNTVNQNTFIGEAEIRNDIPQDMNGGNGI